MINVFLYCSYSGSAVGYQRAVVDEAAQTVRSPREGEIPRLIHQIWTHGGASAAAGVDGGKPYFLVKRIEYQNENKQRDEQGRKVFMNCAFTGDDREELRRFADGFFACYQAAVKRLGELLEVDDTEIGYTLRDFDGLHGLLSSCVEAGRRVRVSRVGPLERSVSFIALEGDWAYFVKQNECPAVPRPGVMMESKAYQRMLAESRQDFSAPEPDTPPPKRPDIVPAAETKTPPAGEERTAGKREQASSEAAAAAKAETPAPDTQERPERDTSPQEPEDRAAGGAREDEAHTEKTAWERAEVRFTQLEEEVKRQALWVKAAAALSAVAILLALILHNWGGGQ